MPTDEVTQDKAAQPDAGEAKNSNETVTANGEGAVGKPEEPNTDSRGGGIDELPESWQNTVRELRAESARYRNANKELREQLSGAKTDDDIKAAVAEYRERTEKLEHDLMIANYSSGVPEEYRELVFGDTEEEVKARADKVRSLLESKADKGGYSPAGDLAGGATLGNGAGGIDPRELARTARKSHGSVWK